MGKGNGGKFALGALVGAAAGAVLGVLFAPRSGKETRKIIKDKAVDIKEKGEDYVKDKAVVAKEALDKVKEKAEGVTEELKDKINR